MNQDEIRWLNEQLWTQYQEGLKTAEDQTRVETFQNADETWHYRASYQGLILQGRTEDAASYTDRESAEEWGRKRARRYIMDSVVTSPRYLPDKF